MVTFNFETSLITWNTYQFHISLFDTVWQMLGKCLTYMFVIHENFFLYVIMRKHAAYQAEVLKLQQI